MANDDGNPCQVCGATVYQQHLDSGIARYENDKLMCKQCLEEYEASHVGGEEIDFAPIALDAPVRERSARKTESLVHGATTATLGAEEGWDDDAFKRPLDPKAQGASRCRTFHSKISEAAIAFMHTQINEWLDSNDQITVKFATTTIGQFEGKHVEPNIIITILIRCC